MSIGRKYLNNRNTFSKIITAAAGTVPVKNVIALAEAIRESR